MHAYTPELRSVGRSHTLFAVKEQIATRIEYLKSQKKNLANTNVFLFSNKTLNAINHRLSELDLLVEAIDSWME